MKKINFLKTIKLKINGFLSRRPHRSFKLTRRRDYERTMIMPGYIKFTASVWKFIWQNRKQFVILSIVYMFFTYTLVGIISQSSFSVLSETLNSTSGDLFKGGLGEVGKAGLLLISAMTGGMSQTLNDAQQISSVIIALMMWLTCIWMLRNISAGHKIKVRDGLYNSGAPILSTAIVLMLLVVQIIPLALAALGYGSAVATGLIAAGGVEAMMFWIAAALLVTLSLYWMTSTFFALIIVTLPGMYPYEAIKKAGDLVVGRRIRIMSRWIWMIINVALIWAITIIPIILFSSWLKSVWTATIDMPIVPIAMLVISCFSIIWISTYVYLLYRKVVSDGSSPA